VGSIPTLETSKEIGLLVDASPIFAVPGTRNVVDEFTSCLAGVTVLDLSFFEMPCHFSRPWDYRRHSMAITPNCQIDASKDTGQFHRIGLYKGSFQDWLRNFKANKVMVGFRRVVSLGHLVHIESKLYLRVRRWVVLIGDDRRVSTLLRQVVTEISDFFV
jgi:hypothetical protein